MCGILAYYKPQGLSTVDIKQALDSLQRIKHRGPDGEGLVLINIKTGKVQPIFTPETPVEHQKHTISYTNIENNEFHVLLGHRRLSIFDVSSAGHQPMKFLKNENYITYNGEIFNFIEIKNELIQLGYQFVSQTDTEVILAAYDCWKEQCFSKFNGMWAMVIWDAQQNKLCVSRDRYGIKPLYYYHQNNTFCFVSEVKQMFDFKEIPKEIHAENVDIFLRYGYVDYDDSTFFKKISRFPKASYKCISVANSIDAPASCYYTITPNNQPINYLKAKETLHELLTDSVNLRMRADVPIGIGVSGGVDSSAIVYNARKTLGKSAEIQTFSAIFPGMEGDESPYIQSIEKDLNTKAHYINPLEHFTIEAFKKLVYVHDTPVPSTSYFAGWKVASLVKAQNIKVLVAGQGADELFGGYHHHFYKYARYLLLTGNIIRYLKEVNSFAKLKQRSAQSIHHLVLHEAKWMVLFKLHLKNTDHTLLKYWNKAFTLQNVLLHDLECFQLPFYLRSDDHMGMSYNIEARFPFLDYRLVNFAYSIPDSFKIQAGWQKYILRDILYQVPDNIRWRKDKKGFTTPEKEWEQKYKNEFSELENTLYAFYPQYKNVSLPPIRKYAMGAWLQNIQHETNR